MSTSLAPERAPSTRAERRYERTRPVGAVVAILIAVEVISAFETSMMYAALPTFARVFEADASAVGFEDASELRQGRVHHRRLECADDLDGDEDRHHRPHGSGPLVAAFGAGRGCPFGCQRCAHENSYGSSM